MNKIVEEQQSPKERLIVSGALLFAERGYGGASVKDICKNAKTSINMIHHYFGNKEGLLKTIVEKLNSSVFVIPMRLLEKTPRSQEDFISRVEMLFEATLKACIDHRLILIVVLREEVTTDALVEYMASLADFLKRSKEQGFVRKELDPDMITGFMLDRISNQVQFAPWIKRITGADLLNDPEYRERWCKSNLDLFMNGMLSQPQN